MLKLDLMRLETPERFQALCARLAEREFPGALPLAVASWDGGRDVLRLAKFIGAGPEVQLDHDVIWQAKFTNRLDANTKRSILRSIRTVLERKDIKVRRWVLCMPVDPTGPFHDWLAGELKATGWDWAIWGAYALLQKLELDANRDLIETFFWAEYEELRRYFRVDDLELVEIHLDDACQWVQHDRKVLSFTIDSSVISPDLVLDLVVRNMGSVDSALVGLSVKVLESEPVPHGLPGAGLLFSQITYEVSIRGGQPGTYTERCDPPLVIKAGGVERFKVRIRDTGSCWKGSIVLGLDYGKSRTLPLPTMRIHA